MVEIVPKGWVTGSLHIPRGQRCEPDCESFRRLDIACVGELEKSEAAAMRAMVVLVMKAQLQRLLPRPFEHRCDYGDIPCGLSISTRRLVLAGAHAYEINELQQISDLLFQGCHQPLWSVASLKGLGRKVKI